MTRTVYERFGVECGHGWSSLIQPLIRECEEKGATIAQVKEKFGGLRFYVYDADADLNFRIDAAERQSFHICEVCGEPGVLRNSRSWLKTLCATHHLEREEAFKKDEAEREESRKRWEEKRRAKH